MRSSNHSITHPMNQPLLRLIESIDLGETLEVSRWGYLAILLLDETIIAPEFDEGTVLCYGRWVKERETPPEMLRLLNVIDERLAERKAKRRAK